jgi:hypothetical protein
MIFKTLLLRITLIIAILSWTVQVAFAQSFLDKKVTLQFNNASIGEVLSEIEKQTNIKFAYHTAIFSNQSKITAVYSQATVAYVLKNILDDNYAFEATHEHIVIKYVKALQWYFNGQLLDAHTRMPIEQATIYLPSTGQVSLTDREGKFSLLVKGDYPPFDIYISKLFFNDTIIKLYAPVSKPYTIYLAESVETLDSITFSGVKEHWLAKRIVGSKALINTQNLKNFFSESSFQLSLLPGIASKNRLSSQQVNKVSFNVLGGFTGGVNGLEIGSLFNVVQKDMRAVQIGGLFNYVGGNTKGLQMSGIYNHVHHNVKGVQVGGVFNIVDEDVEGVQLAGVFLKNRAMNGCQVAGVLSLVTDTMSGVQLAGVSNIINRKSEGVQVAGVSNTVIDSMLGGQVTGLFNSAKHAFGFQIAGLFNVATQYIEGIQIAGLVNYAKHKNGVQIGIVNISDTGNGPNLGLININKKGWNEIDVAYSDIQDVLITYKSGSQKWYNIIQAGMNTNARNQFYSLGVGMGFNIHLDKKHLLQTEAIMSNGFAGEWQNLSNILSLQTLYKFRFTPHFSIAAGPAFRLMYCDIYASSNGYAQPNYTSFPHFTFGSVYKGWLGYQIGLQYKI